MHDTIQICDQMTGMYQSRDIVSQGTINLGTRCPRTFVRGHSVWGRPVTPPYLGSGAGGAQSQIRPSDQNNLLHHGGAYICTFRIC